MSEPAKTLKSAYVECNPDAPLKANDDRYIDLANVRGEDQAFVTEITKAIIMSLPEGDAPSQSFYQQLVTGHRGCGKSTELLRLKARLEKQKLLVVYFDVENLLNLVDADYIDILLLIATQVEKQCRENNIILNDVLLDDIYEWFSDKVFSKERQKEIETKTEVEAKTGVTIPIVSKLLARVSAGVHRSDIERQETRQILRKEWNVFVDKLNALLGQARKKAKDKGLQDLVVIVDGLEKVFYEPERDAGGNLTGESSHSLLFVKHAEQLFVPECHLIYTVPISLGADTNLGQTFDVDNPVIIPMVNIKNIAGVVQLVELVKERVDIEAVFEDKKSVEDLAKMSGGAVRDLMRLIRNACLKSESEEVITRDAVALAIKALVREYSRMVQEDDVPLLRNVLKNRKAIDHKKYARLLHTRMVHEYLNGEPWLDLHPAVREISWVMEQVEAGEH